jgi:hypothetical protein
MAGKSDEFETAILKLIFNNDELGDIGDVTGLRGSTTPGNFYFSLHTGDPTESVTNPGVYEAAYDGYARVGVARSTSGWTVSGNTVSPVNDVTFGECVATPGDPLTHFALTAGDDGTGDELVLYYGELTPSIVMSVGVVPVIKKASGITED